MPSLSTYASALIRVGVQALSPVLGGLLAVAAKEGAGVLVSELEQHRLRDIQARCVAQMSGFAEGLIEAAELKPAQLEPLFVTATEVLRTYGLRDDEWHKLQLDPIAASRLVACRGKSLFVGLAENERQQVTRLLGVFYDAMKHDREALANSEAEFRSTILQQLERLPDRLATMDAERNLAVLRAAGAALLSIPHRIWRPDLLPPGTLLRADCATPVPLSMIERQTWKMFRTGVTIHASLDCGYTRAREVWGKHAS